MLLFPLCAYLHRLRTRAFAHLPDRLAYRQFNRCKWHYLNEYPKNHYLAVRRHLSDVPTNACHHSQRMAIVARPVDGDFLDPVLQSLSKEFETYYYPAYHPDLFRDASQMDVIWIEWGTGGWLLSELKKCKKAEAKLIIRVHDYELRQRDIIERSDWSAATDVVFVNVEAMAEFERLTAGRFRDKQRWVPNVLREGVFPIKREFSSHGVLLMSVGLQSRKNYERAIRLFSSAHQQCPHLHLYIRANPTAPRSHSGPVFELIRHYGLEENVTFLVPPSTPAIGGHNAYMSKTDVVRVYQSMGAVLSTSDHEAFHYTIAEGSLCGLYPIVHHWSWGQPETMWGPYVARDDDEFVSRLVRWGQSDDATRMSLGKEAREYVVTHFGQNSARKSLAENCIPLRPVTGSKANRVILVNDADGSECARRVSEYSMGRIREYLNSLEYELLSVRVNPNTGNFQRGESEGVPTIWIPADRLRSALCDILFWWRPRAVVLSAMRATDVWDILVGLGIPYQLHMHSWHLGHVPAFKELLHDPTDEKDGTDGHPALANASSMIVNARHIAELLKRTCAVDSRVAYDRVPRLPRLDSDVGARYVTLAHPQDPDELRLLRELATRLPAKKFLLIGSKTNEAFPVNVLRVAEKGESYNQRLRNTEVLLFPVREGAFNIGLPVLEAYCLGIPVIAPRLAEISEMIPTDHLVESNDSIQEWIEVLARIETNYASASEMVSDIATNFDEMEQLAAVREELDRVMIGERLDNRVSLGELVDARYRLSSGTGTGTASDDLLVQGFRLSRIDADHEHNTPHG